MADPTWPLKDGGLAPSARRRAGRRLTTMPTAARRMMAHMLPFKRSAVDEAPHATETLPAPLPGTPLYLPGTAEAAALHADAHNGPVRGAIGSLEVRLATSRKDVHRAQRLRYTVFYEEMSARPTPLNRLMQRDYDRYDPLCDHLLVLDHDAPRDPRTGEAAIVGTYRLLSQDVAAAHGGFYTADEYEVDRLVAARPDLKFLELGRSCVLRPYRTKRTVELLWHGIWSFVVQRKIDVLFGCASLEGTDPEALALPLSFLHHTAQAQSPWTVRAVADRYEPMNRLPSEAIDPKQALKSLPPLIKGYLRLGGMIGDGAVIDHQFGTTDVLVLLPVDQISKRYISYYGADASRRAN